MIRLSSLKQVQIKVFRKVTKFGVFNFRGTFFSWDFNLICKIDSQKSRKLSLAKKSDDEVNYGLG